MKIIQLYLNSNITSGKIVAVGSKYENLTYNIDWKQYFGDWNGQCRLKVYCCTDRGNIADFETRNCIMRLNFDTPYSNIDDGVVVGSFDMQNYIEKNGTSLVDYFYYMELDTRGTSGITINRPTNSQLVVKCSNIFDNDLFTDMYKYHMFLIFEIDDPNF